MKEVEPKLTHGDIVTALVATIRDQSNFLDYIATADRQLHATRREQLQQQVEKLEALIAPLEDVDQRLTTAHSYEVEVEYARLNVIAFVDDGEIEVDSVHVISGDISQLTDKASDEAILEQIKQQWGE